MIISVENVSQETEVQLRTRLPRCHSDIHHFVLPFRVDVKHSDYILSICLGYLTILVKRVMYV